MTSKTKILLGLIICIACVLFVLYPVRFVIQTPRLGQPRVITAGELIDVEIKSSMPIWNHQWEASLRSADTGTITPVKIISTSSSYSIHKIRLETDLSLAPGKYDLIIRDQHKEHVAEASVHIWASYPESISIVQLADLPFFSVSGDQDGDRQFAQIIDEINIINPDLVLFTGDLVYGGSWQQYQQFFTYLKRINAPIIAAPGNHEYQGWSSFLSFFGQPFHVNNIGPYKVISINSGHARDQLTASQLQWLRQAFDNQKDSINVLQIHHSIMHRPDQRGYLHAKVPALIELAHDNNIAIILSGHWHADSVWNERNEEQFNSPDFAGVPYVVTTSAGAILRKKHSTFEPLYHGYRLIRIQNGKLANYTYDYDGDGKRDTTSSIPMGKLTQAVSASREVSVINGLNESFENARIDIRVQGNVLNLQPDHGKLQNQFFDGKESVYSIIFNLPANSTVNIGLHQEENKK